jgi:hypothetical protein
LPAAAVKENEAVSDVGVTLAVYDKGKQAELSFPFLPVACALLQVSRWWRREGGGGGEGGAGEGHGGAELTIDVMIKGRSQCLLSTPHCSFRCVMDNAVWVAGVKANRCRE